MLSVAVRHRSRRPWLKKPVLQPVIADRISAEAVRAITRGTALHPRFRPIDRYLWRWSVSQGSGVPIDDEDADRLPRSRPTPLPDDEAVVVDMVILNSPAWVRAFAFKWFRSDKPVRQIAEELGMSERAVYLERQLMLAYYLGRLTEAGIPVPSWEPPHIELPNQA